ncbi:MAG TPA: ribbon-helix-helix protein, CopG family [Gaiellaceae bacterium]|jgi:hypothetical protein
MRLERRFQILLDEPRYRRLETVARERGVSVAAVIRDAIDVALPAELDRKREAWQRILDAEPVPVPATVAELRRELDEIRTRGLA